VGKQRIAPSWGPALNHLLPGNSTSNHMLIISYSKRHNHVQTSFGVTPAYCPGGDGVSFPGGKMVGVWNWPFTSI